MPFYAASTIKLAVLIAVMRMVDDNSLVLEQKLSSQHEFLSSIPQAGLFVFEEDEVDVGMPPVGDEISLWDALDRMITVSSNETTNMAVNLTGLEAVNEALRVCQTSVSKMERLIGDHVAMDRGLTNEVSVRDLTRILSSIVNGLCASAESTDLMIELLRAQQLGVIGEAIPSHEWGSKSGWVNGIRHDVAFFAPPGSGISEGYILAVCTRGYEALPGTEAIQAIASLAWDSITGLRVSMESGIKEA